MSESTHCSSCGGHGYNEEPGEFSNMYTCGDCGGSGSTEGPAVDIEDMATGTTLVEAVKWTVARDVHGNTFLYRYDHGYGTVRMPSDIDASTIRDVTPPPETPEKE